MKAQINTYRDLKEALKRLNSQELDQTIKVFPDEGKLQLATLLEIETEDFFVNNSDPDDFGYTNELIDTHGDDFDPADYRVAIPKGSVIMYTE